MEFELPKGRYVVAVSGGVDSVVLLDLLARRQGLHLVVAHFDHGIRSESVQDERFVRDLATKHSLKFESKREVLGQGASEAVARSARYAFLRHVKEKYGANKIVTAHHQDDLLETMILNMLRGTGRRGLDPLHSSPDITRPLLSYSKQDLLDYAVQNGLAWRADSTNDDIKYRRNKVRQQIMPKLQDKRAQLLQLNEQAHERNRAIDALLAELDKVILDTSGNLIRQRFVQLPHKVAAEYIHWWLLKNDVQNIDSVVVHRATIAAKTLITGKKIDLGGGVQLHSGATSLQILPR